MWRVLHVLSMVEGRAVLVSNGGVLLQLLGQVVDGVSGRGLVGGG